MVDVGEMHQEDLELIEILWERGVPPTAIADQMAFLNECRDAENLRSELLAAKKKDLARGEKEWPLHLAHNQDDAGSIPAPATKGVK